jgi:hypothetical protein
MIEQPSLTQGENRMGTLKIRKAIRAAVSIVVVAGLAGIVQAQQPMAISPAKGQSAEQLEKDKAECTTIAQQSVAQQPVPPSAKGGRARGAARGAAVGAVQAEKQTGKYDRAPQAAQDEYRQQQAKQAAKSGAMVGGAAQRQSAKQQAQQQGAGQASATDSAFRSCMTGRGYTVQ